jgi:flagellar motor protein MotB
MAEHEKHDEHSEGHGGGGHGGGGHGGGGAHEEHEGAPEWLISFADNVALMMGFFVILLAMNMAKKSAGGIGGEAKMGGAPNDLDFVIAIRQAFNPIDMDSTNPAEEALRRRILERAAASERSRQPEEPGKGKESQAIRPTDLSSLGGTIPFDDNADALSGSARSIAETVASKLVGQRFMIEIRGHSSPSETMRQAERGIALSHSRALAVARVLVSRGIRWDQIRIVACGDNERKVPRSYDEADKQNQRVDVIPTGDPAPDSGRPEGTSEASAGGPSDH